MVGCASGARPGAPGARPRGWPRTPVRRSRSRPWRPCSGSPRASAAPGPPRGAVRRRPRRSGVHRLEQRLARRRPRPRGAAGRQAGRPGRGRPGAAADVGSRRRRGGQPSSCRCCWASSRSAAAGARGQRVGVQRRAEAHRRVRGCPTAPASGRCPPGWSRPPPARPSAPWWLVGAGAALGAAAHLANVAPDLEEDLATGVRGLPHRLGARASAVLGAVVLGGATLLLVLGPPGRPGAGRAGRGWPSPCRRSSLAALAGSGRWRRLAFPAVMLLTVVDVVLLLAGGRLPRRLTEAAPDPRRCGSGGRPGRVRLSRCRDRRASTATRGVPRPSSGAVVPVAAGRRAGRRLSAGRRVVVVALLVLALVVVVGGLGDRAAARAGGAGRLAGVVALVGEAR